MEISKIEEWLAHPGADIYFGRRFAFKFAVLAVVVTGKGNLSAVARQFRSSPHAAYKHARHARQAFGL